MAAKNWDNLNDTDLLSLERARRFCVYLVHTNGECRALNQRAKRRHFCLLYQKYHDLLSIVTL